MSKIAIPDEVLSRVRTLQLEIDQLQANLNAIEQQNALISRVVSSINDALKTQEVLKNKRPGDEILVPIGGSNYILCTIKEPQKTFISLGSGVSLHTELNNSEERNKSQIENLQKSTKQLREQHEKFSQKLNSCRQELYQIAQKHQIL